MQVLKLEQNLFQELGKIDGVIEKKKGESIFRTLRTDLFSGLQTITAEKRKYPYFYKYYLYFGEDLENPVSLREEKGAEFLIRFYEHFCPAYVKNNVYNKEAGMQPDLYFHMDVIPGESMQHYVPGEGAVDEKPEEEKKEMQGYRALEGYHEFSEEEKQDVGSQLDALKDQFADQLKELEALMGKKVN